MTIEANVSDLPALSWIRIWWIAFTKPSVKTYERIAVDPCATIRRACKWIFVTYLVCYAIFNIVDVAHGVNIGEYPATSSTIWLGLLAFIIDIAVGVAHTLFSAVITHLLAKLLRGTGAFSRYLFNSSAYLCPALVITFAFKILPSPYGAIANLLLIVYEFVLHALVLKAVHRLGWLSILIVLVISALIGWFIFPLIVPLPAS